MKILIDAAYIHNSGGKEVLSLIIENIQKDKVIFLLDSRLKIPSNEIKKLNCFVIKSSEKNRKKFYKKRISEFTTIVCLGNVPPPIKIMKRVVIYFHNTLFVDSKNSGLTIIEKLILKIKKRYIQYLNQNHYEWVVQTELMKKKIIESMGVNISRINIFPIFRYDKMSINRTLLDRNFLYVSSHHKHKNLVRLIKAFSIACEMKNIKLSLNLTIEDHYFQKLKKYIPQNSFFNLINHGYVSKEVLSKLYSENTYFIYPSLKESFGITLIEAESYGARLLCADLPYVHEIVSPSSLFNPFSIDSIVNCLIDVVDGKVTKESQKKVNNKIDNFTDYITKDV